MPKRVLTFLPAILALVVLVPVVLVPVVLNLFFVDVMRLPSADPTLAARAPVARLEATSPHESVTVTVEDGVITDGVIVQTSDATALITYGFTLSQDASGALVVDAVSPDSPAWEAGLEAGDVVVGITMAGFSLNMDGEASALAQLILGRWDGPGITLQVLGADGFEETPLTW